MGEVLTIDRDVSALVAEIVAYIGIPPSVSRDLTEGFLEDRIQRLVNKARGNQNA